MCMPCVKKCSQSTCEEELLFSHLNFEVIPGENNRICQMGRSRQHSLNYRTPEHIRFLSLLSTWVPAVSHLLVTEDASNEKGDMMPGRIDHFTASTQAQVSLTKAKVAPADLRWWRRTDPLSEVWGSHWPTSPAPQTSGVNKTASSHSQHHRHLFGCSSSQCQCLILGHNMKQQMRSWKAAVCMQHS